MPQSPDLVEPRPNDVAGTPPQKGISRRQFLKQAVTVGTGAGLAATNLPQIVDNLTQLASGVPTQTTEHPTVNIQPALSVPEAHAAPVEGGADPFAVLPQEIQDLLRNAPQLSVTQKQKYRIWRQPDTNDKSAAIRYIGPNDSTVANAVTHNDWFFGSSLDSTHTDQPPQWGFFTKDPNYVDYDKAVAEGMVRLTPDQERSITVALFPNEIPQTTATHLRIEGTKFVERDGNEMRLKGAVASHFVYDTDNYYRAYGGDIDRLSRIGANFVSIQWNSGFFDNPVYIQKLLEGIQYAKSKGLRVELTLHSRGIKQRKPWVQENQIEIADNSVISDWQNLIACPGAVDTLKVVDVFSPLAEPQKASTGNNATWAEWKPIAVEVINLIRNQVEQNATCLISGAEFGSKAREGIVDSLPVNTGIEIHPYRWTFDKEDYRTTIAEAKGRDVLVMAGEIGFEDDPEYVRQQIDFFRQNGVSFAWFGANSARANNSFLFDKYGNLTANGIAAQQSFA